LGAVGAVLRGSCWVALARAIGTSSGLAATCGAGVQRGTEARLAEVALTGAASVAEQGVAVTVAVDAVFGNSLGLPHGPFAGSRLPHGPFAGSLLGLQGGTLCVPAGSLLLELQVGTLCVPMGLFGASDRGDILAVGHCAGNSPLGKMAALNQA